MITLISVQPTGTHTTLAFVDGYDDQGKHRGGVEPVEIKDYPLSAHGQELRRRRTEACISMGELARALGVSVVSVSSLERGGYTLSREDWEQVFNILRNLKEKEHGGNT